MSIQEVAVVSIPVSDTQRAKEFYLETLGLDLVRDDDSIPGIWWVQVAPKGSVTSMVLANWFDSMTPGSLRGLVIRSDDIHAEYERLVAQGVQFEGPPQRQPWAIEAVFSDPDGNNIVLQQIEATSSNKQPAAANAAQVR